MMEIVLMMGMLFPEHRKNSLDDDDRQSWCLACLPLNAERIVQMMVIVLMMGTLFPEC